MVIECSVKERERNFTIKDNILIGNSIEVKERHCLGKILLDALSSCPESTGIINADTGEETSYKVMRDWVVRCSLWLQKHNFNADDIVCVSSSNHEQDFVPLLAAIFARVICNPWHSDVSAAEARNFFDMIRPKMMFASETSIDTLAEAAAEVGVNCQFIVIGNHPNFISLMDIMKEQSQDEVNNFTCVEPENSKTEICIIFFSSGTTGSPKGTMLSYSSLVKGSFKTPLPKHFRKLWYANLSWTVGVRCLFRCIRYSAIRILHKEFEPEETSQIINRFKVNWLFLSPTKLTSLCMANIFDRHSFPSLEVLSLCGSKPSKTVLKKVHSCLPSVNIMNTFGMTELGCSGAMQTRYTKNIDSIGYVVENVKLKIIDVKSGRTLGPNKEGELCFKVETAMLGYFKNPKATQEMIDGEGWLHSGDLGYYDEDGEISITTRIKELIIYRNHRICPSDIEDILLKHPGVSDVAVVGVPHAIDTERPFAFVVKTCGSKVSADELSVLPESFNKNFTLTGGVVFVDDLLYTSTGKKNLRKLKALAEKYTQQLNDPCIVIRTKNLQSTNMLNSIII